jgi:hypothetical protein
MTPEAEQLQAEVGAIHNMTHQELAAVVERQQAVILELAATLVGYGVLSFDDLRAIHKMLGGEA